MVSFTRVCPPPPKWHLDQFSHSARLSAVPNTQTTERATAEATGRIYAMRAMRSNNNNNSNNNNINDRFL